MYIKLGNNMNKKSILQITSSLTNGIGTGFVIDSNKKGVLVATCSHVVTSCGAESLLVEGFKALV